MDQIIHIGGIFKESKYGYKLSRETYIPTLTDGAKKLFSERELKRYINECYKNFDLNMEFFGRLDPVLFNKELNIFLDNHPEFKQTFDIMETKNKKGYYIMVLDEYKQLYIGTTDSCIYKRLRRHMAENQEFDRLIWTDWKTSRLSINSFRPLDTTRIYVYITDDSFNTENEYINCFSDDYILNRTDGGVLSGGLLEASMRAKFRKL